MKRIIFLIVAGLMVLGFSWLPAMASSQTQVAISISPTSVNFGSVLPGRSVSGSSLTITNTGSVTVTVSAEITGDTSGFYRSYLKLNNTLSEEDKWASLGFDALEIGNDESVTTKLEGLPSSLSPGSYTCTVIFWAEVQ